MRSILLSLGYLIALVGSVLIFNQYFGRFVFNTDIFSSIVPATQHAHERAIFAEIKFSYILYASSFTIALFAAPSAFEGLQSFSQNRTYQVSPSLIIFVGSSLLLSLSGAYIAFALGETAVGGAAMMFYWSGFVFVMLVVVMMIIYAVTQHYFIMLRDWLVHLYAIVVVPLSVLPMTFFWVHVFGFTLDEAMVTSVSIAFSGNLFISYFLNVQLLGTNAQRS